MISLQKYKLPVFTDCIYITRICFLTCCSLNGGHHDHYTQSSGVLLNTGVQPGQAINRQFDSRCQSPDVSCCSFISGEV